MLLTDWGDQLISGLHHLLARIGQGAAGAPVRSMHAHTVLIK